MLLVLFLAGLAYLALLPWRSTWTRRFTAGPGRGTGPRRQRGSTEPNAVGLDLVVVLELIEVAAGAGAPVPRALEAVGDAIGGEDGRALREAGAALVLGASWQAAWGGADRSIRLAPISHALRGAWENGAAPGRALRAAGEAMRREGDRRIRTAAGQLGVQLVLPVGLCLLPAFVLIGLVPIFVSLGVDLLNG